MYLGMCNGELAERIRSHLGENVNVSVFDTILARGKCLRNNCINIEVMLRPVKIAVHSNKSFESVRMDCYGVTPSYHLFQCCKPDPYRQARSVSLTSKESISKTALMSSGGGFPTTFWMERCIPLSALALALAQTGTFSRSSLAAIVWPK